MNPCFRVFCRAYQLVFRAALPLLPYREPVELTSLASIPPLLEEKGIKSVLLVTDHGVRSLGLTGPLENALAAHHIALRRGPIVLAQENRLGYSVDDPVEIAIGADGYVDAVLPETDTAPYPHIVEACVPLKNGASMTVTDYASAGKLWTQESRMAAWMLTE